MNRVEKRRQAKDDEKITSKGFDVLSRDPNSVSALTRELYRSVQTAIQSRNVDVITNCIFQNVNRSTKKFKDVGIACGRGCSHCCNIWVSATAPELLHVAKIIKRRGEAATGKLVDAYQKTNEYSFDDRGEHPYPCPLLENDECSIYSSRPRACRLAASADAEICARSYHNVTDEGIPTPFLYIEARGAYGLAVSIALHRAGLPYRSYEFNAGLLRAIEVDDAESRWLRGEDVFEGVQKDPYDTMNQEAAVVLAQMAFSGW